MFPESESNLIKSEGLEGCHHSKWSQLESLSLGLSYFISETNLFNPEGMKYIEKADWKFLKNINLGIIPR